MILQLVVGVAIALAILALFNGLSRDMEPTDEVEQRIEDWVTDRDSLAGGGAIEGASADSVLEQMERSIARTSFSDQVKTDLARADLALTVTEYLLIRGAIVLVLFGLGYAISRNLLAGLLMAVIGFFLPMAYVRTRQRRRLRTFNDQLPDVLDHLVGSLRAGYGLLQSVEWVARQVPAPAGAEFDRVIREVQLGRSLNDGLDSLVRRINSDDLALIVTAIKIQHEVGGSLAEILATVSETIRERVRIQREISVLTSQQRYSGYVLMFMPIALGIVLFLINPEYEMQLFAPGPTLCIPIGTAIMMVMGFVIMRRIVDIEV